MRRRKKENKEAMYRTVRGEPKISEYERNGKKKRKEGGFVYELNEPKKEIIPCVCPYVLAELKMVASSLRAPGETCVSGRRTK